MSQEDIVIEQVQAIGFVAANRPQPEDDFWGGEEACITLEERFTAEALQGITDFSHVEILYRSAICRVIRVEGAKLFVSEPDAFDGTPVLDIKPVRIEFLPRHEIRQPAWSHDLMR